jgi:hypothetical protein
VPDPIALSYLCDRPCGCEIDVDREFLIESTGGIAHDAAQVDDLLNASHRLYQGVDLAEVRSHTFLPIA